MSIAAPRRTTLHWFWRHTLATLWIKIYGSDYLIFSGALYAPKPVVLHYSYLAKLVLAAKCIVMERANSQRLILLFQVYISTITSHIQARQVSTLASQTKRSSSAQHANVNVPPTHNFAPSQTDLLCIYNITTAKIQKSVVDYTNVWRIASRIVQNAITKTRTTIRAKLKCAEPI